MGPCHFRIINAGVLFKLSYKNVFFFIKSSFNCGTLKHEQGQWKIKQNCNWCASNREVLTVPLPRSTSKWKDKWINIKLLVNSYHQANASKYTLDKNCFQHLYWGDEHILEKKLAYNKSWTNASIKAWGWRTTPSLWLNVFVYKS